jgi:uncharacterized protein (TIGR02001 family)
MHHENKFPGFAVAALLIAPAAQAVDTADSSPHAFAANAAIASQYVFRGLAQTNGSPAIQGGVDYAHSSGLYAGTWASNISWFTDTNPGNSATVEWDGYAGFRKSFGSGLTTDIGYLSYEYPGEFPALPVGTVKPNTDEVFLGLGWKWVNLKYSYAFSDLFGVENSDGSYYLDLAVTIPFAEVWTLALHAGQQTFEGASTPALLAGTDNDALYSYEDYRATLSFAFGSGWTATTTITSTTARDAGYTVLGENLGDDQFVLALSRVF